MNDKPQDNDGRVSSAQQRVAEMRAAEERKARTRNAMIASGVVVAIIGAVLLGMFFYNKNKPQELGLPDGTPKNLSAEKGISLGKADAPSRMDVYVDYICPACKQFEAKFEPTMKKLVDEGKLRVVHHPIAILDGYSRGTKYSTRAANLAYCTANFQPEKFEAVHAALFTSQPQEQTTGLTNEQLITIAKDAGVTADLTQCMTEKSFHKFVTQFTKDSGVNSTPTVLLDGTKLEKTDFTPEKIIEKVNAKAGTPVAPATGTPATSGAAPAPTTTKP